MVRRLIRLLTASAVVLAGLALLLLGVGPMTGRYRVATVLSGSMEPTLPTGGIVVSTPVPRNAIGVGDVITFNPPDAPDRPITHRVVEVVEAGDAPVVRTMGDANAKPDAELVQLVDGSAWRMRAAVPGVGWVLRWLQAPAARMVAMVVSPILLAFLWLRRLWFPPPEPGERPRSNDSNDDDVAFSAVGACLAAPPPEPCATG
jgi:signal peptidase